MRKTKISIGISLLICLAMMITPLSAALADPQPNLPETGSTGTLTVHKYAASAESDTTGTGMALTPAEETALGSTQKGVTFKLYKVDKEADLKAAVNAKPTTFDPKNLAPYFTLDDSNTVALDGSSPGVAAGYATDAAGLIEWENLPIGYYVLKEIGPLAGYTAADDTIITMPMGKYVAGQPTNDWNYNVHVYPKNVKPNSGIRKEIVGEPNQEHKIGDTVEYTIETMTVKTGEVMFDSTATPNEGSVEVIDVLDPRLSYVSSVVKLMGGSNGVYTLSEGDDYTYTTEAGTGDNLGKTLHKWKITKPIWYKTIQDEKIKYVRVELKTTVNNNAIKATTDGDIESATTVVNSAYANVKWAGKSEAPVIPTDPQPEFKLVSVTVVKRHWESGAEMKADPTYLNGAKFKIAKDIDDAKAGIFWCTDGTFGTEPAKTHLVVTTAGTATTLTHDHDKDPSTPAVLFDYGLAAFVGLPINDSGNTEFVLVESEAPADYVKSQSAWPVTVYNNTAGKVQEVAIDETTEVMSITDSTKISLLQTEIIDNQHIDDPKGPMPEGSPTFKLPKTGGMGTVLFIAVGAGLLVISLVLFKRSRKEEEEELS